MQYIIKLPNQPDRIVENINYEVVSARVETLGGTLLPIYKKYTETVGVVEAPKEVELWYTESMVAKIFDRIKIEHFPSLKDSNIRFSFNGRLRRVYGRAWTFRGYIELSTVLLKEKAKFLEQVIYHEMVHMEFPEEGHTGMNFRYKEMNNPYRTKRTNRLTIVS